MNELSAYSSAFQTDSVKEKKIHIYSISLFSSSKIGPFGRHTLHFLNVHRDSYLHWSFRSEQNLWPLHLLKSPLKEGTIKLGIYQEIFYN